MKAVGYRKSLPIEDKDALIDFEAARPEPTGRDIRVAVNASFAHRRAHKVRSAGSLLRQGPNPQFHLVDERITGNKPKSLSSAQAAALPLTSITAWELLFDRLCGVSGESVGSRTPLSV